MKTYIIIMLIMGAHALSATVHAQVNQTIDNTFGILELFDGVPLYANRSSEKGGYGNSHYIPIEGTPDILINKSNDGNSIVIKQGTRFGYTLELHKTKVPGEFTVRKKFFGYKDRKSKVTAVKILEDGSLQMFYTLNGGGSKIARLDHYKIAGIGLKLIQTFARNNYQGDHTTFYETKEEHQKTSENNTTHARIISFGETNYKVLNSTFRFAAAKGDEIEITTTNVNAYDNKTYNIDKIYLSLYSPNGDMIKETEGIGKLKLSYSIPDDGFYYISTVLDDTKYYIHIMLNLKN